MSTNDIIVAVLIALIVFIGVIALIVFIEWIGEARGAKRREQEAEDKREFHNDVVQVLHDADIYDRLYKFEERIQKLEKRVKDVEGIAIPFLDENVKSIRADLAPILEIANTTNVKVKR